jgi:hypothetical protein
MASPAPAEAGDEHEPPLESLVHLRYAHHRRVRNRRIRHRQESVLAKYRFWIMMAVLLSLAAAFVVGSLHEVQHLFGI